MSPLGDARCLSPRCSRERHCDGLVIPFCGGLAFLRSGHFTSTFLLPLAPPRCVARLHRYYESSDFCQAVSSDVADIAGSFPLAGDIPPRARAIGEAVSPAAVVHGSSSTSCAWQISLLIAFDLPTIPSPTTASPFRHGRFRTLLHRRDLPRLSHGQTQRIEGFAVARSRVRALLGASPTGLAVLEFTCVTDWSFVSGCSPPFLTETQLPLSTTGRQRWPERDFHPPDQAPS